MLDIVGERERANVGIYCIFVKILIQLSIAACMFTNQDNNEKY